ncbi:MAG TPA: hypothetical protein VFG46_02225 [Chryseolinea sp.]|nr:hypothetical protein [Chryseolinea sp.]
MDTKVRIAQIENFIHLQRYLHGLHFHVLTDPDDDDAYIIEFKEATQRQLLSLNHSLRTREMSHIRCRAQEIVKEKHHNGKKIQRLPSKG